MHVKTPEGGHSTLLLNHINRTLDFRIYLGTQLDCDIMDDDLAQSWPPTPDSPRAGSLYHATTTIDDLTLALINYSRVPSPEPTPHLTCCCGKEDCENTKGWLAFKLKLESRLILSAGKYVLVTGPQPLLTPFTKRLGRPYYRGTRRTYTDTRCARCILAT